jgi:hypothetical protein
VVICGYPFSTRGGPNVSGDRAKVYHRSLDVLQTWLTDCRLVDFSPKSILLITLENFLTNEVIKDKSSIK